MDRDTPAPEAHYWYDGDASVVAVLHAVRRFRRADQEMRRRMSEGMDMNVTDLQALQFVIAGEGRGEAVTPRQLSAHLRISTASTTKLLDRLTASGHLARSPHPRDRRSLVLTATAHAHDQIRERLAHMHERMADVARSVPPEAREAVVAFLAGMAALLDEEGGAAPLTPR
ncbi:MarR family winged helix-turn-helix transcriptional regulator [Georgenia sp. SYP-B2076]|uniref:MarR family winged helix-turn-helix transcriptional regulator n=1 Tax=Georgenia sp. SYP-B2076 TaxID=2495881 RepID=UPI001F0C11C8|nr:MarR family transcriptional regulator [Georgenia sp. SYP-B2076]